MREMVDGKIHAANMYMTTFIPLQKLNRMFNN